MMDDDEPDRKEPVRSEAFASGWKAAEEGLTDEESPYQQYIPGTTGISPADWQSLGDDWRKGWLEQIDSTTKGLTVEDIIHDFSEAFIDISRVCHRKGWSVWCLAIRDGKICPSERAIRTFDGAAIDRLQSFIDRDIYDHPALSRILRGAVRGL